MRHPAILEAASFFGSASPPWRGHCGSSCTPPGMTTTPVELRKYLQEQVAPFKIPRRIVIRNQLPKGTTGKIMRRKLTDSWVDKAPTETRPGAALIDNLSIDGELVKQLKTGTLGAPVEGSAAFSR